LFFALVFTVSFFLGGYFIAVAVFRRGGVLNRGPGLL
jgi:hypothetical protein